MAAHTTKTYAAFTKPNIRNHNFNWSELAAAVLMSKRGRRLTAAQVANEVLKRNPRILKVLDRRAASNRINATLQRMAKNNIIKSYRIKDRRK